MTMSQTPTFFDHDLSEAQAQALEAELLQSPELAEKLLAEAEARYQATGLPQPRWSQRRSRHLPKGLWLLGLLVAGGTAWALALHETRAHVVDVPSIDGSLPVVSLPREDMADTVAPAKPAALTMTKATTKAAAPVLAPAVSQGHRLNVVLNLREAAQVRVQVMDAGRQVCRRLFNGRAPAGKRNFEWDGTDDQGKRLPPGDYQMQVNGDGFQLSRPLRWRPAGG